MKGKTLRAMRNRLGLTQVGLAKELGVTGNSVARWERDEMKISEPVARLVMLLQPKKQKR